MDIKEFVKETIKQIVDATDDSRQYIHDKTGVKEGLKGDKHKIYTTVKFDLSVTTMQGADAKAGVAIKVLPIVDVSLGSELQTQNQTYSRIQFDILVNVSGRKEEGIKTSY